MVVVSLCGPEITGDLYRVDCQRQLGLATATPSAGEVVI